MQFNPNASSQQVAAPSTFLCRVPSKTSMQQFPDHAAPQYSSNASTRSSSAVSIAALPSLSNGLNELANITSMEKISLAGTRTAAEGEEMVSLFLHFVLQSTLSSVAYCLLWYPETYFVFPIHLQLRRLVESNSRRLSSSAVGANIQEHDRFMRYDDSDESDSDSDDVDDAYARPPQSHRQATRAALQQSHYPSESRGAGLMMSVSHPFSLSSAPICSRPTDPIL